MSSPLLGAFNVKYVLEGKLPFHYFVTRLMEGDPFGVFDPRATKLTTEHLTPRYEDGLLRIHQVTDTYRPRAYFPTSVVAVTPGIASASRWLRGHPERLTDTVVVEVDQADPTWRRIENLAPVGPLSRQSVSVRYPSDATVEMTVETDKPAVLVLNDVYEAGWRAEVDGTPREILPTNLISRGVFLEAGQHTVVMHYQPPGLRAGLWLGGGSLLGLLGIWGWAQRQKVGPAPPAGLVSSPQLPV